MTKAFKKGETVEWQSSQGAVKGTIAKKITSSTYVKGHAVAATTDHPQYLVRSNKTGSKAAHKPEALKKRDA